VAEVDAVTLFDVQDLRRYWAEHPPVHLLVGGLLGAAKSKPAASSTPSTEAELRAFLQMVHHP
jgi:hypothetical protein